MTSFPISAADYSAGLFVPPEDAYRWVMSWLGTWQSWNARPDRTSGNRVLALRGERGIGKTWLLHHLAQSEPQAAACVLYCDLEERTNYSTPERYIEQVHAQLLRHRGASDIVFLLDSVPPNLDKYLRAFEDALLKPYLDHGRCLVIMALIHPVQTCWRIPALRVSEQYTVPPFSKLQTDEQLRRLEVAGIATKHLAAADVWQEGGGLPLLNYLLATRPHLDAFEWLLDYWLSRVPAGERANARSDLEVVCVLDALEHAPIRRLLEVFVDRRPDAAGCPAHPLGVLNLLQKYWLGQAQLDAPGCIVLAESVCRAARKVLQARDAELYARLKEAAQLPSRRQV
jgi:hypothetical protein